MTIYYVLLFFSEKPAGSHHMCASLEDALSLVSKPPLSDTIENVWIIGGGAVYKVCIETYRKVLLV